MRNWFVFAPPSLFLSFYYFLFIYFLQFCTEKPSSSALCTRGGWRNVVRRGELKVRCCCYLVMRRDYAMPLSHPFTLFAPPPSLPSPSLPPSLDLPSFLNSNFWGNQCYHYILHHSSIPNFNYMHHSQLIEKLEVEGEEGRGEKKGEREEREEREESDGSEGYRGWGEEMEGSTSASNAACAAAPLLVEDVFSPFTELTTGTTWTTWKKHGGRGEVNILALRSEEDRGEGKLGIVDMRVGCTCGAWWVQRSENGRRRNRGKDSSSSVVQLVYEQSLYDSCTILRKYKYLSMRRGKKRARETVVKWIAMIELFGTFCSSFKLLMWVLSSRKVASKSLLTTCARWEGALWCWGKAEWRALNRLARVSHL